MVEKSDYQCWHGTYVTPDASGWIHTNSRTRCDDPNPMYKPQEKKK